MFAEIHLQKLLYRIYQYLKVTVVMYDNMTTNYAIIVCCHGDLRYLILIRFSLNVNIIIP